MSDPCFLYRYRSLDGDSFERVVATLENNKLYFASPPQLNDPFDCKVHFSFDASDKMYERYYRDVLARKRTDLLPHQREEQARRWIREKKHRTQEFQRGLELDLQSYADGLGILCFSEKPDNILMWSYYASGHTGICLEFALSRCEPFLGRAAPVRYRGKYPRVNLVLMSPKDQVDALLFTKSRAWSHEAEWRIVDHDKGPGIQCFLPNLLTGVILGCRIAPEARDKITALVTARQPTPRLVEAVVRAGAFGVDLRTL